ncbi:hypothetical protein [Gordonia rubripertincta]|uniref:Uncharacterized protein n=1 Tax=Gordonia rubripertincta NBRC 101908 TaxID=1077975 RepID=A0ABQ0HPU1_GORRU|nr:hypothetical protein [Gordonia rubripertincta]GAB84279.1 hypothetical protein GORBP_037_00390 [Gordonia rubripertincta NBRC 101908]
MTDTVFDSAVGPASAATEVPVNAAVLDDVRSKLRLRGLDDDPQVVLLGLDGNGRVSVGRFDTSRGTVADSYSDPALSLGALDRAIADHLARIGRVESPTTPEWQDELFELISRGRERLQDSDGTFLMGRRHIRLFRMARRDVEEAGGALIARGEELARAAVAGAQAHAVVITDGLGVWPGLRDGIAKAVPVPIVDAAPGPLTAAAPTGPLDGSRGESEPEPTEAAARDVSASDSLTTPGEEPAADVPAEADTATPGDFDPDAGDPDAGDPDAGDRDRTPAPLASEVTWTATNHEADGADSEAESASEREVEAAAEPAPVVDDSPEPVADESPEVVADAEPEPSEKVTDRLAPPASGAGPIPPDEAPTGKLPLPFGRPDGSPGRSGDFPVVGVEEMPQARIVEPVDPAPATAFGALAAYPGPSPVQEPAPVHEYIPAPMTPPHGNIPVPEQHSLAIRTGSAPVGPRHNLPAKRIWAGVALVCALAVIGVAVALAAGSNGSSPAPVAGPTTPATTAPTTQEYADPAIFAEARQPAQRYTPPPPPVATNEPAPSPRPRSRAPRPQRGVTIPNPIPGLPPIVLP